LGVARNQVRGPSGVEKMKRSVTVRGLTIGEGAPKICVPMVGETLTELLEEAAFLKTVDLDVVEWRVDFFEHVEDLEEVKETLKAIRSILLDTPLVFTFRSAKEGGEKEVSTAYYFELNKVMAESGQIDVVDVELFNDEEEIKRLVTAAHNCNVSVIISNHDFDKTPAKDEIVSRLRKAQELGGDLPKIAVMPRNAADVLTLLDATNTMNEQFADRPIITMSMAGKGVISRLAGEIFGSALTFGAAKKASAPGQVPVTELRRALSLINSSL
jgi:3-dehydroquinate dehydratase I